MSETASVYVIGGDVGPQKIGLARNVEERKKTVQVGCPFALRIHHIVEGEKQRAAATERLAHAYLAPYRQRGEWFNVTPVIAVRAVKRATYAAARGRDAPRSVAKLDGIVWLLEYAALPHRLLEAAFAYRELAEICEHGAAKLSAITGEDFSHRRVLDAKARLAQLHRLIASEKAIDALRATALHRNLPTPGSERELIKALDLVAQELDTTISA